MLSVETVPVTEKSSDPNLLNILILDDERTVRDACREVATALGFHTFTADTPEHAFRILDANSIDVVLLDLRLPGIMGWICCAS